MCITGRDLDLSERTIYREVHELTLSGIPIRSENGVGDAVTKGFDLSPLIFTKDKITALVLDIRIVRGRVDGESAVAADNALAKIETVLPPKLREKISPTALYAPNLMRAVGVQANMSPLMSFIAKAVGLPW